MRHLDGYTFGVNLGGWLSQYDKDTKEYFDSFITETDIRRIKTAGFDHVRLPVNYEIIEDEEGNPIEEGYAYIDECVRWCRKADLNLVLDLHQTYGYTFDPLAEGDKEIFFHDTALQDRFYKLWDRISARYHTDADMLAFELLNEIVSPEVAEDWNKIADKAIDVIRKNAPNSYIIVGGICYNSVLGVPLLNPPKDEHIVYNFHCYEPMVFTHQGAYWVKDMPSDFRLAYPGDINEYKAQTKLLAPELAGALNNENVTKLGPDLFETLFKPAIEAAEKNNAPLYCGEYGVIELADPESAKNWFKDIHSVFDKYGIGHAAWNYKEKDYGKTVEAVFF